MQDVYFLGKEMTKKMNNFLSDAMLKWLCLLVVVENECYYKKKYTEGSLLFLLA